jgi:hypothetical protein
MLLRIIARWYENPRDFHELSMLLRIIARSVKKEFCPSDAEAWDALAK